MKELLKNQAGAVIIVIILVLVLATAGGGVAFLAVRMVVSGDGNFLQPFEELGWIDPKEDSDEDAEEKKSDNDEESETTVTSGDTSKYLIEEDRLSEEAKESGVEHYYGEIPLGDVSSGDSTNEEDFSDINDLLKAGVNIYAKDGKVVEIAFGFDITEYCKVAYEKYPEEFEGYDSAEEVQEMMMELIDKMFEYSFTDEYSEYISKYSEGGVLQLYVTEKGFESLYETYGIEAGENDVDTIIESLEEAFDNKIEIVKK